MASVTIDIGALRHNLQTVRRLAPASRAMAVIKANAYGHGLITAARALEAADALAVARVSEALALREAGIQAPIVLLEGVFDRGQLDAAAAAELELIVHTEEQIELLRSAPAAAHFKVWLKLDSGMNRLGFKGDAFHAAYAALSGLPALRGAVNLCTHLASADLPELPTTAEQLMVFGAATRSFEGERSMAGSAAIIGFPESHGDWVRPGLMLYGISPFKGTTGAHHGLRPVMTFQSRVIALKDLSAGEQAGYGGDWTAPRPSRLAIASVGYGDGYPRSAASGTPVLVNDERAGLAGRVSMDMLAIDVTDLKRTPRLGDPVVLWGEGLPVEEIALWAETVPYTLVCGISRRVAHRARD
ncbi:MAG TPA: alanine racemase [Steroidobacteraceae bacterium]|jgi:alanine racemase|nr:alanine racemase [Steroidobacteraceae bacterium]